MCGILGQVNQGVPVAEGNFRGMLATLLHRGPDGSGVELLNEGRVALGHARLSIIDLSEGGHQPMANDAQTIWLTYNGEIYNYKALTAELKAKGHRFRSQSDSEVIIQSYEEWGTDCVKRFRGIFAFGIYDSRDKSLFIARDHVGVKPLYYYADAEKFVFASQPKSIIACEGISKAVDPAAFALYLGHGNVPADYCIYRGLRKLLPGHSLLLKNGKATVKKYWELRYQPVVTDTGKANALISAKVEESTKAQSVSDVQVGVLLSGGVDSTIITSVLRDWSPKPLPTFTIGFDDPQKDETAYAKLVADAFRTDHHQLLLNYDAACSLLPEIVNAYDEPFHLNGLFPYMAVSRLAHDNNIKVAFGGDGADELFAGYLWYDWFSSYNSSRGPSRLARLAGRLFGPRKSQRPSAYKEFFRYNGYLAPGSQIDFAGDLLRDVDTEISYEVLRNNWKREFPATLAAQLMDFNCFMVDHCLTKVDRASMACGLEVRVPFLDIELVEAVFSIDHSLIYRGRERKALLKQANARHFPAKMDTTRKKGFSSPVEQWLRQGLEVSGRRLLKDGSLVAHGLINADSITKSFDGLHHASKMMLISAELWCRRWMDGDENVVKELATQLVGQPSKAIPIDIVRS